MQKSDFVYYLPPELIAQQPLHQRTDSRLLCMDGNSGVLTHRDFINLPSLLEAGDLLVLNDTQVIPARLYGHKASGGKIEVLIERLLNERQVLAHVRASKSPKPGTQLLFDQQVECRVIGRRDDLFVLEFDYSGKLETLLQNIGHMPLPPYIQRPDQVTDQQRYQTVFAHQAGAVAAPTAGLHFDNKLLQQIQSQGVELGTLTLHVGSGTFQPMRSESLESHKMHSEIIDVNETLVQQVKTTQKRGGRVIAVGTTVVRALESAVQDGELQPFQGETDIFIKPGYHFACVDALISNFHLSESTLLVLVSAFAGYDNIMTAYQHAIEQSYRFFSYGDAMFMTRRQ